MVKSTKVIIKGKPGRPKGSKNKVSLVKPSVNVPTEVVIESVDDFKYDSTYVKPKQPWFERSASRTVRGAFVFAILVGVGKSVGVVKNLITPDVVSNAGLTALFILVSYAIGAGMDWKDARDANSQKSSS